MTVQVQAPNGEIVEFPDGTSDAVMERAMAQRYGGPSSARTSRRGQRAPAWREASGALAAVTRGIPFANDISAIGSGVRAAAPEAFNTFAFPERAPSDALPRIGQAFQRGMRQQRDFTQDVETDFGERRPNVSALTTGTAAALPVIASAGAAAPEALAPTATRGLSAWLGQTARGATAGAGYGAVYGAGTHDGDVDERLAAANEGAAFGGAFGAAAPTVVNAARPALQLARPAWETLTGAAERLPTADPNALGAFGGNLRTPPPRAPRRSQGPPIPPSAIGTIDRLAQRARMSSEEVGAAFETARANPQGQVLADVFRDPGVRTTRAIAQGPGETGQRAADVAERRFQEAPDRIIGALRRTLHVSESRGAALKRLGNEYERASADLYRPVLRQRLSPEQRSGLEGALAPFADDPIYRDAARRAEEIFSRDRRLGLVAGSIDDSFPRYAHFIKMGLDDAVTAAPVGSRGVQATEMRGVQQMRQRVVQALDTHIPGYGEARARWGGLRSAEEALDEGADFLSMNADEVASRVAEMTPFELTHARIGMADAISHSVGRSGKVVGNANIANSQLLNSPEGQRRIAALFETPAQAADFLDTVTAQNRLMRNAASWGAGSPTYSNVMHGADEALHTAAEMGGHAITGNVGRAVESGARGAANFITGGALERANNQRGAALLTRIDGAEAKRFTDAVVSELRRREAARRTAAAVSQVGATGAGATAGRRKD